MYRNFIKVDQGHHVP